MLIHIENYRNIKNFDYEIIDGKINYLYGICGSGKSSIVDAVTRKPKSIDASIGCTLDDVLVRIDEKDAILQDVRIFNDGEREILFSETATPGVYEIFIGNEGELNNLEEKFNESVLSLRTYLDSMYSFQGRISELQKALGKPSGKGSFTSASKVSKAARAAQNSTPFIKRALTKGGLEYIHWLNEGKSVTSDYHDNVCPFCEQELSSKNIENISILETINAADLKPIFAQSNLLEELNIDKSLFESKEGENKVKDRLLELNNISKELGKVISFCNTARSSLLDTGLPKLEVEDLLYKEFPELEEPIREIVINSESINILLGKMKEAFSSLISANVRELNIQLKILSVPYRFSIRAANREGKTADYVLVHIKAADGADMKTALSTGEKNLVSLLLFLHRKDGAILMIDDPASSFDDYRRTQIFNIVHKVKDKTVLVVSHDQAFIKRAVRARNDDRIGKIQEIHQDNNGTTVNDIVIADYVFLPDRIKMQIKNSQSLRQLFINLRLLCELHRVTLSDIAWGYVSMKLHRKPQAEINEALNESGMTEEEILEEIFDKAEYPRAAMNTLKPENEECLSDFEKLIEIRETLDVSKGNEYKTFKEMLNDLVHMNDALAYCLDPYKFHVWPIALDTFLESNHS